MTLKEALQKNPNWWAENMPNFKMKKFNCKYSGEGAENMDIEILLELQRIRTELGKPLIVTSGYRSKDHPVEKKKAKPGSHHRGKSVDVACFGKKSYNILSLATNDTSKIKRIGIAQKGNLRSRFIHLQISDEIQSDATIFSY